MFGCSPSHNVIAYTEMVNDIARLMRERFDHNTLLLAIPESFEQLKGRDANFEMVTSNTIQPVMIEYKHNIVARSAAAIFVSTECNALLGVDLEEQKEHLAKFFFEMTEGYTIE